jgi:hypothetical protein
MSNSASLWRRASWIFAAANWLQRALSEQSAFLSLQAVIGCTALEKGTNYAVR